jgi:hypothetical protein
MPALKLRQAELPQSQAIDLVAIDEYGVDVVPLPRGERSFHRVCRQS